MAKPESSTATSEKTRRSGASGGEASTRRAAAVDPGPSSGPLSGPGWVSWRVRQGELSFTAKGAGSKAGIPGGRRREAGVPALSSADRENLPEPVSPFLRPGLWARPPGPSPSEIRPLPHFSGEESVICVRSRGAGRLHPRPPNHLQFLVL